LPSSGGLGNGEGGFGGVSVPESPPVWGSGETADAVIEKPHPSENIVAMMPTNRRDLRGSEILMI